LRTSLIVGFPGETEGDFKELCDFLNEYKLDNVGVFKYSKEDGTPAAVMENQIDEEVKEERQKELMLVQKIVVQELNKLKISKVYDTIIDGRKGKYFIGRSSEMAPEIDGIILINTTKNLERGEFVKVEIKEALEYDLVGEVCNEFSK
ncbi:30S ribosomal protein S12 methylthiotransferase RimO, partial [Clostridium perfringens]|nr:30S ribosomal protein S12 methylthiotransferase RimO [Clostridium perfringens]